MQNDSLDEFKLHRGRLYGIAYRMLSSKADAEDVLQEAYIRWHATDVAQILNAQAWLVTVTTRLSIDCLRLLQRERETYSGPWLPEPLVWSEPVTPEWAVELASDVSMAFLLLLERLTPEERAALLLHDIFDVEYVAISDMLGKTQSTCRQLVHRARERVSLPRARFKVDHELHRNLLERFVQAANSGNLADLRALMASDALLMADGGGKVVSVNRILYGADRIARLYHVAARQFGSACRYQFAMINGIPGLLRYVEDGLDATISIDTNGQQLTAIYTVRHPDKLQNVARALLS